MVTPQQLLLEIIEDTIKALQSYTFALIVYKIELIGIISLLLDFNFSCSVS